MVNEAVESGVAPDRPVGFYKSKQCKFCAFKDECWSCE
jgi:CRISPR/Cas system-associated exonuclease Cas4 (RecB family)